MVSSLREETAALLEQSSRQEGDLSANPGPSNVPRSLVVGHLEQTAVLTSQQTPINFPSLASYNSLEVALRLIFSSAKVTTWGRKNLLEVALRILFSFRWHHNQAIT